MTAWMTDLFDPTTHHFAHTVRIPPNQPDTPACRVLRAWVLCCGPRDTPFGFHCEERKHYAESPHPTPACRVLRAWMLYCGPRDTPCTTGSPGWWTR